MGVPVRPAAAPANAAPEGESPSAILGPQVLDVLELTRLDTQSVDIRDNQVTIRTAGSPSPEQVARTAEMLAERLPRAQLSILDGTGMPVRIPEPSREEGNRAEGEQIFNALSVYGFEGRRYFVARDHATLVFSQSSYRQGAKPIGRAARVLANYAPPHVEFFTLILMDNDLPTEKITLLRKDVEKAANGLGSADESWTNVEAAGEHKAPWRMSYDVGAFPHLRQSLGGPDSFLLYQLYMEPTVSVRLFSGFRVEASAGVNIVNNYEKFTYEAPSNMPRVRTRVRDYVKGGDIWVQSLHADYAFPIIPEWYGAVSAGLFEQMYGGVAGEVLYRPQGARWALGLDVNHVWQRTPGETAAFDPYHITTGHLSYYHLTPYHDVYYTLSAGRYLAGDVGVTGVLGRRLENGVEIGIWATKTNVSAAEFGEGSFDKGMYVRIPLDLFYTSPSRQSAAFPFRPLIRDGGQKVATPLSLHGMTGGFKQGASDDGWRDMWR